LEVMRGVGIPGRQDAFRAIVKVGTDDTIEADSIDFLLLDN